MAYLADSGLAMQRGNDCAGTASKRPTLHKRGRKESVRYPDPKQHVIIGSNRPPHRYDIARSTTQPCNRLALKRQHNSFVCSER